MGHLTALMPQWKIPSVLRRPMEGFFTFGYHAMPYAASAAEAPVSECAGCHMANVAKTDMTWV